MTKFKPLQRRLHWLTVALLLAIIPLGLTMDYLPGNIIYIAAYTHFVLGISLLTIVIYRTRLHFKHNRPEYPKSVSRLSKVIAISVQFLMLGILTIQPIIGLLFAINYPTSQWGQEKSDFVYFLYESHELIAYGLFALISLHILGFLKHLIIDRTNLISRIW